MRYLSYISTSLLGLLFLVSAFAKAWDADTFAHLLQQYGSRGFSVGAPVIIFAETVIGMLLLLRVQPRKSAWAAVIFLIVVSVGFAYGVLFRGIEDCGCFGELSRRYAAKPWMTFTRNAVLVLIAVPAILDKPSIGKTPAFKPLAAMCVGAVACFCCGLAMKQSFRLPKWHPDAGEEARPTMEQLHAIYPFSADSSYVVYLFSFTCAHCQNYFANVQQYQQMQLVDKVIGIAVEDAEEQARFERVYQPEIEILTIPHDTMASITGILPVALLIRGDSIENTQEGFVTSPGIYME